MRLRAGIEWVAMNFPVIVFAVALAWILVLTIVTGIESELISAYIATRPCGIR